MPVSKEKATFNFKKWNVRILMQNRKLDNIKKEMERMEINLLGLSKVRWKRAGVIQSDVHTVIYTGGNKHKRGAGIIMDENKCQT